MTKAQQPEPPAPDMRARFEAFFTESRKSRGKDKRPTFHRLPDDTYSDDHTQRHWWTWQCAQAAVLADRESRKVVAWPYMPSPTWGEYVITQDPKVAEVARSMGVEVEELTVGATSKVEDSHG